MFPSSSSSSNEEDIRIVRLPVVDHDYTVGASSLGGLSHVKVRVVYQKNDEYEEVEYDGERDEPVAWNGTEETVENGERTDYYETKREVFERSVSHNSTRRPSKSYFDTPEWRKFTDNFLGNTTDTEEPPTLQPITPNHNVTRCRLCTECMPMARRKQHVRKFHLRRYLYRCPHCPFSSTYHIGNVRNHMRSVHKSKENPLFIREELQDVIDELLYICFMDKRILSRFEQEVVDTVLDLVEWASEGIVAEDLLPVEQNIVTRNEDLLNVSLDPSWLCDDDLPTNVIEGYMDGETEGIYGESSLPIPSSSLSLVPIVPMSLSTTNYNPSPAKKSRLGCLQTCQLCGQRNISKLERHVLQYHVKKPMYLCPYCNYSSTYAPNSVKDHISSKHSGNFNNGPIDIRERNGLIIRSVHHQCFPFR